VASHFDLQPRLAALEEAGLKVASEYRGVPSIWLTAALDDVDVCAVNVKGVKLNDTIMMLRLSKLEELVASAGEQVDKHAVAADYYGDRRDAYLYLLNS
jgi:hypothetical protein